MSSLKMKMYNHNFYIVVLYFQLPVRDGGAGADVNVTDDSVPDPDDPGEGPSNGKSLSSGAVVEDADSFSFHVDDDLDEVFKTPAPAPPANRPKTNSALPRSSSSASCSSAKSLDRFFKASSGTSRNIFTYELMYVPTI